MKTSRTLVALTLVAALFTAVGPPGPASATPPPAGPALSVDGGVGRIEVVAASEWRFLIRDPEKSGKCFDLQLADDRRSDSELPSDWNATGPLELAGTTDDCDHTDTSSDPDGVAMAWSPDEFGGRLDDVISPSGPFGSVNGWGGRLVLGLEADDYTVEVWDPTGGWTLDSTPTAEVLDPIVQSESDSGGNDYDEMDDVDDHAGDTAETSRSTIGGPFTHWDTSQTAPVAQDVDVLFDSHAGGNDLNWMDPDDQYGYLRVRDGTYISYNLRLPDTSHNTRWGSPSDCERGYLGDVLDDPVDDPTNPCVFPVLMRVHLGEVVNKYRDAIPELEAALALGVAVLEISVRGSGCSSGSLEWFQPEQSVDGYDVVEIVASQPWSNGRVATVGGSGDGLNQLHLAASEPPSLVAMSPTAMPQSDAFDASGRPGGVPLIQGVVAGRRQHEYTDGVDPSLPPGSPQIVGGAYKATDAYIDDYVDDSDEDEVDRARCRDNQLMRGQSRGHTNMMAERMALGSDDPDTLVRDTAWPDGRGTEWGGAKARSLVDRYSPVNWIQEANGDDQLSTATAMVTSWQDGVPNNADLFAELPTDKRFMIGNNGGHGESAFPEFMNARFDFLFGYLAGDTDTVYWAWNDHAEDAIEHFYDKAYGNSARFNARWDTNAPGDGVEGIDFVFADSEWGTGVVGASARTAMETSGIDRVVIFLGNGGGGSTNPEVGFPYSLTGPSLDDDLGFREWPPPSSAGSGLYATDETLYLNDGGALTTSKPEGMVSGSPPRWSFQWDPTHPTCQEVHDVSGLDWDDLAACQTRSVAAETLGDDPGAVREWIAQRAEHSLTFTSHALADDVLMAGDAHVTLYLGAESNGSAVEDVDLEVNMYEVDADGSETYVQSGAARASFRNGNTDADVPAPDLTVDPDLTGDPVEVRIQPFVHEFPAGSRYRIRIEAPGGDQVGAWIYEPLTPDVDDDGLLSGHPVEVTVGSKGGTEAPNSRLDLPVVQNAPSGSAELPDYSGPCGGLRYMTCRGAPLNDFGQGSADSGPAGWTGVNAEVSRSLVFGEDGDVSLRLVSGGDGSTTTIAAATDARIDGLAVTAGEAYDASVEVLNAASTARTAVAAISWFEADGTWISTSTSTGVSIDANESAAPTILGAQAPRGAVTASLLVIFPNIVSGEVMHLDNASIVVDGTSTNLLSDRSDDLETGGFDWAPHNATIERTTADQADTDAELRLTLAAQDTGTKTMQVATNAGTDGIEVDAGEDYTFDYDIRLESGIPNATVAPAVAWYDGSGNQLSEDAATPTSITGTWTNQSHAATAPSGAERAQARIKVCDSAQSCSWSSLPADGAYLIDDVALVDDAAPSVNLLSDRQAAFDSDPLGWGGVSVDIRRATSPTRTDAGAFEVEITGANPQFWADPVIDLSPVDGQRYTAVAWVRAESGAPSVTPYISWFEEEEFKGFSAGTAVTANDSGWTRVTMNAPEYLNAADHATVWFGFSNESVGTVVYFDDLSFCPGNTLGCASRVTLPG